MEKHPLHMKIPELQKSEEVEDAVEKRERLEKETIPNDATQRIDTYMDRLEKIFLNPDQDTRERNIEMLRESIHEAFVIKPEDVPESFFDLQKRVARERGENIEEISADVRRQMIDIIIADQKASLDSWVDYLTSKDATYPTWFKYFVFQNIVKLSQFDKTLNKFKERTKNTTAIFPDIFREPLAQICDVYEKVEADNKNLKDSEVQKVFSKSFPKIYAEKIQESLAFSIENKENIDGRWVKYEQNMAGEAERLYKSLENKGTGWCTAGMSTAKTQIKSGDFYVYYTFDKKGEPTQPRIAIRMNGKNQIGEVRGVLEHQSLESQFAGILDTKLSEFGPEADRYKKKVSDMRRMTEVESKIKKNENLTKEDLIFLYEIDSKIEGFGYDRDPRVAELRAGRDMNKDALIIFECTEDQIAHNVKEISPDTKAYIGPFTRGLLEKLPENLEHLYTKFPEGKIEREKMGIGMQTKDEILQDLESHEAKAKNIKVGDYASDMLKHPKFEVSKTPETISLITLSVADLGFTKNPTFSEIVARADELDLIVCPPEVGPLHRLKHLDQQLGKWVSIAMDPLPDRYGVPKVFRVGRDEDGLWLRHNWASSDNRWSLDARLVFLSRKFKT